MALAMLSASNPQLSIMDMLSKLSHDNDAEVAHNSIFAMGVVAAGTNNARLAGMLRQLAQYYNKDASNLFMVRIAQVSFTKMVQINFILMPVRMKPTSSNILMTQQCRMIYVG